MKSLITILSIFFMFLCIYDSVNAMEGPLTDIEENFIAEFTEEDLSTEEEDIGGISLQIASTISHSSLGINKYVKSRNAYNLSRNQKIKIQSVTWSPSGQKIQLGFINADNGKRYWTKSFSGGNKSGGTFSLNAPKGKYYIAIRTPSTNTKSISVSGSFEF